MQDITILRNVLLVCLLLPLLMALLRWLHTVLLITLHDPGIIGAKNQGAGVAGVVPGMPIVAFKVLGRDGSGSLDNIYKAYAEVVARQNRGEKIVAINLSLGSPVMDADSLKVECDWVKKLTRYGTTMVAAAGERTEPRSLPWSPCVCRLPAPLKPVAQLSEVSQAVCTWQAGGHRTECHALHPLTVVIWRGQLYTCDAVGWVVTICCDL